MKKYMLVISLGTLSFLFAETANPFSVRQHLEQLDKDKDALLKSLAETNNASNKLVPHKKPTKKVASAVASKSIATTKEKANQIERQKRLAKIKKIRKERAEALRIKKHKEALLRQSQQKTHNKKHIESHATLQSKKALTKKVLSPNGQHKPIQPKEVSLTKQEALEQAYLDAIKEVNE